MKVILLKDLKNYGKKNDVINVSDGYAQNYLFPNKIAVVASKNELGHLNSQIKKSELELEKIKEVNLKLKLDLEKIELNFKLKINNGKPIGSVSLKQIEDVLMKQHNLEIDKRKFLDHKNLNEIGLHYLKIKIAKDIETILKVKVEGI